MSLKHKDIVGDTSFKCDTCGSLYANKANLRHHTREFHGPSGIHPPLKCDHCSARCWMLSKLASHEQVHYVKSMTCTHCDEKFCNKDSLKRHMRKHSGQIFWCSKCKYTTSLQQNLQVHNQGLHRDGYMCQFCDFGDLPLTTNFRMKVVLFFLGGKRFTGLKCPVNLFQGEEFY